MGGPTAHGIDCTGWHLYTIGPARNGGCAATMGAMEGRVLIVDDSPTELHVLTKILKQGGHEAITAADGEAGIAAAQAQSPDAILMDVVMPGMNGFQATRALSKDEQTKSIPIGY